MGKAYPSPSNLRSSYDICASPGNADMFPSAPQIDRGSQLSPARPQVLEIPVQSLLPSEASPNSAWELLSELIANAWMLHPHLGSGLVNTSLTSGYAAVTPSFEERCGPMFANPVKSSCTSTIPGSRSAQVAMRAYNCCTAIDPSKLAAEAVW